MFMCYSAILHTPTSQHSILKGICYTALLTVERNGKEGKNEREKNVKEM
jgi:hypothetical protein